MKVTNSDEHRDALIARNAGWMLLSHGGRLMIQAVYFLLMARHLGPQQYGAFVAVASSAAILAPFVGNGSTSLMIRNVARDRRRLPESFGAALLTTFVSGVAVAGVVVGVCLIVLPRTIPASVIVLVVLSEALVLRFVDVGALAFQAVEELRASARINVVASLMRLAGLAAIIVLERPTLLAWSMAYALAAAMAGAASVLWVVRELGAPRFVRGHWRRDMREGFYFSVGMSAQTIYNDIDKSMLARWSTLDSVGIYAAAYRLIDVAFVPIRALLAATYAGFFRSGAHGIAGSVAHARRWLPRALWYSSAVAVVLALAAPLVPWALGQQYLRTTEALRWLSVLPVLKTLHYFAADSLTGADFQGVRTLAQIGVAALNVAINAWTIPAYGWRGAAWSSLAADAVLAVTLWGCVTVLRSRKCDFEAKPAAASQARGD